MSDETTTIVQTAAPPARLLVVDDEENILLTISEVLRLEGYEVETAASGREAVLMLDAGGAYDLVLTDLHMEEGDGLLLLEEIRRRAPLTITIVLTGFAAVESAIAALRQGAYDYLTKPCIIAELIHTVARGIEHRRLMLAEREARASLEELNRELERRVEERTAELQRVNRELTEANRAKDVFLATLSHELRTPLTPVLGWVGLLRSGGGTPDPLMLAQGLEAIQRNAQLQARLIDDLLDISRVVSGKLRIDPEPVNLSAIVESAAETVRAEAESRSVELSVELPDGPVVVQGAPLRLQQIVWNLLSNAVKFTPRGGRVAARVSAEEGGEALVEVADTGIGIAPAFLPHVFDRFRQADGSTTRQYGGLGLGLAIVRALAELHGGWVRADSEGLGRGSRFTFGLPHASPSAAPEEPKRAEEACARNVPVLVVDDSAETVELLQMLFARRGYDVVGAGSAAEAVRAAGERAPGLIISDISMPGVDGYALLAELRRMPGLEGVPAIALTGHAMDEDRARALAAGFAVHVPKPVDPDELLRVVRKLTA
ncbi:MAG TPA: response regulator [Pyrinomonadaceae bacterium]|jgi:signal transduction histidine kinase|nr:response regulator [Pyrinomonadaceae bacterium]